MEEGGGEGSGAAPPSCGSVAMLARVSGISVHGCYWVEPPSMDDHASGRRWRADAAVDLGGASPPRPSLGEKRRFPIWGLPFPSLPWREEKVLDLGHSPSLVEKVRSAREGGEEATGGVVVGSRRRSCWKEGEGGVEGAWLG